MEDQSVIVIENAAECNLKCPACPTQFAPNYPHQFMDMERFDQILKNIDSDIFPQCALMGWGEPLLDPSYSQKLIALKQAGFYVGSTSNCTVLTQEKAEEIMDCGLDYLGISFDVNHSRGLHNHLEAVVGKLEAICRSRDTRHKEMKIGINVVLFRTEKERLFEFLDWLQGYPVWSISVAPLIMIPDQAFFSELTSRKELEDLQSRVRERFPDLPVSFGYLETEMQRNCRSDVFHNVYVDYMGNVCPCCVLAMGFPNVTFDGQRRQTEILHFGNLTRSHIQTIWDGQLYSDFRAMFAHNTIPEHCQCCNAWRVLPSSLVSEELGI